MANAIIKKDIAVAQAEPKIPYLGINKIFSKNRNGICFVGNMRNRHF